jgi:hypothetical protein
MRSLMINDIGDVLGATDLFSNTVGDYVSPRVIASGQYVADFNDGTSVYFIYVAPYETLALPSGGTFSVDELVMRSGSVLSLSSAAIVVTEPDVDPSASIVAGSEGDTILTAPATDIGPIFRDVPVAPGATVFAATSPGDVNLDGSVNVDDVALLDHRAVSGQTVDYGPTYAALPIGPLPVPSSFHTAPLPVVTHLDIPH